MACEPPFERTDAIDALCMEIAELVGVLSPQAPLATNPALHRELRIQTICSSLMIEGNSLDERAVSAVLDGQRVLGDPRATVAQLGECLGCSKRSAERVVAQLKEEGALARQGSARAGVWVVRDPGL